MQNKDLNSVYINNFSSQPIEHDQTTQKNMEWIIKDDGKRNDTNELLVDRRDTLSGLFLVSTAPTAPPSDLPNTTIQDESMSVL